MLPDDRTDKNVVALLIARMHLLRPAKNILDSLKSVFNITPFLYKKVVSPA